MPTLDELREAQKHLADLIDRAAKYADRLSDAAGDLCYDEECAVNESRDLKAYAMHSRLAKEAAQINLSAVYACHTLLNIADIL